MINEPDEVHPLVFINQFYQHLMNKYSWLPLEIDEQDFYELYEMEFGDNSQRGGTNDEYVEYADELDF